MDQDVGNHLIGFTNGELLNELNRRASEMTTSGDAVYAADGILLEAHTRSCLVRMSRDALNYKISNG